MTFCETLKDIETIHVHDGRFHFDDVLAVALLRMAGCEGKIVRSRNFADADKEDKTLHIDVGGMYDGIRRFDHHQEDAPIREKYYALAAEAPKTRFCAAGLLWQVMGPEWSAHLLKDSDACQKLFEEIDSKLIMWADYRDNGHEWGERTIGGLQLADFIAAANDPDVTDKDSQNARFSKAVEALTPLLKWYIEGAAAAISAEKGVRTAFSAAAEKGESWVSLSGIAAGQWKKTVQSDEDLWQKTLNIKAVVTPGLNKTFAVTMMPQTRTGAFDCRCKLTSDLADRFPEFVFIHHNGFMGVLSSNERIDQILEHVNFCNDQ